MDGHTVYLCNVGCNFHLQFTQCTVPKRLWLEGLIWVQVQVTTHQYNPRSIKYPSQA